MLQQKFHAFRRPLLGAILAIAAVGSVAIGPFARAEEAARRLPEATIPAREDRGLRTATFAGGCFWGVQGVFQNVRGVSSAVSGYAGGDRGSANYRMVSTGRTDHAEVVRVTYDSAIVRYDELLRIFFSVALDPTQVGRQGPDTGPQYRSALFPTNAEQARVAKAYIAQLDAARAYARPIATRIEAQAAFFPAEDYHQDFMTLHPDHPYIVAHDAPKLRALKQLFPDLAAPAPVLLGQSPT